MEVDAGLKALLTPEKIREIVHWIPDEWLNWEDFGVLPSEIKDTYVRFLVERVAHSEIFIKEAQPPPPEKAFSIYPRAEYILP